LTRKRSRDYLHSPDPQYQEKLAVIEARREVAQEQPGHQVLLYADEFTCYRQPASGVSYFRAGSGGAHQPLARRSLRANTKWRVAGALDASSGAVLWRGAARLTLPRLGAFLAQVRAHYGPQVPIALAWDNWPVHGHPQVLAAAADARVELLFLPTYAPWTNPIEKLWGYLKHELLRLHPWADRWEALKEAVGAFLDGFAAGSLALLHRVGLLPQEALP